MKMVRAILLSLFAWLLALACPAQTDSFRNVLKVGLASQGGDPVTGGLAVERVLSPRASVSGTISLNPFYLRSSNYWPWFWHFSAEFRYYFALRRGHIASGFYTGAYIHHDRGGFYHRGTMIPYIRDKSSGIGLALGYQHAFGKRIRAGVSFIYSYGPRSISEGYTRDWQLRYRAIWRNLRKGYTTAFIGFSF